MTETVAFARKAGASPIRLGDEWGSHDRHAVHTRRKRLSASSPEETSGVLARLSSLVSWLPSRSVAANVVVMLVTQAVAASVAIGLDLLGFSDATAVIVFVLGVLFCAILTYGQLYSLVASVVSIISYNYFLIDPRLSLQINGRDYAGTITAMFLFALLASYLVTNLRRSYQLSAEASLAAERAQLRANLLRSVSHDLRTPLTSIIGDADMLLDEHAELSDAVSRQLIDDIYHDATWLRGVVENLLAVTRLEDGNVMLQTEVELVDDVIEEAMRHVSRDARLHRLSVVPSGDLLLARLDPQVIVQVIVNLVNNAIDHTPVGSSIVISSWREGDAVAVSVADDGPGIPDEEKDQVFELFYTGTGQGDSGRNVGLGLSLCRSIVRAHGGEIRIEDADPRGARFVFTLPAEEVGPYE